MDRAAVREQENFEEKKENVETREVIQAQFRFVRYTKLSLFVTQN